MNYLAGPLTLSQIPDLNLLAGAQPFDPTISVKVKKKLKATYSNSNNGFEESKPELPGTVQEYFYTSGSGSKSSTLAPTLIAIAEIRYLRQKPPIDFTQTINSLVEGPRETGQIWEDTVLEDLNSIDLSNKTQGNTTFSPLPEFMKKASWWSAQEKEFEHWIYETNTLTLRSSKILGVSVGPEVSEGEFRAHCKKVATEKFDKDVKDLDSKFKTKVTSLENKIERQELKVDKFKKDLNTRGLDTALKLGESLFKLASKGKLTGVSSSSTKVRMTAEARSRLKEAETILENYQEDLKTLQEDFNDQKLDLKQKWENAVDDIKEVKITPTKQNIRISHFGILWKE